LVSRVAAGVPRAAPTTEPRRNTTTSWHTPGSPKSPKGPRQRSVDPPMVVKVSPPRLRERCSPDSSQRSERRAAEVVGAEQAPEGFVNQQQANGNVNSSHQGSRLRSASNSVEPGTSESAAQQLARGTGVIWVPGPSRCQSGEALRVHRPRVQVAGRASLASTQGSQDGSSVQFDPGQWSMPAEPLRTVAMPAAVGANPRGPSPRRPSPAPRQVEVRRPQSPAPATTRPPPPPNPLRQASGPAQHLQARQVASGATPSRPATRTVADAENSRRQCPSVGAPPPAGRVPVLRAGAGDLAPGTGPPSYANTPTSASRPLVAASPSSGYRPQGIVHRSVSTPLLPRAAPVILGSGGVFR